MKVDGSNQTTEKVSSPIQKSAEDPRLKSIQSQMENVREKMKRLAENKNVPFRDKEKMMKELRMELQDLKWQFSNRQKEIIKEKMEKNKYKNVNKDDPKTNQNTELKQNKSVESPMGAKLETSPLKAVHSLIGANASISEIEAVNAIKKDMENQSEVIKSEIWLNKRYFMPIEHKLDAVYDLNEKIDKIEGIGAKSYSDVQESIEKSKKESTKTVEKDEEDQEVKTEEEAKTEQFDQASKEKVFSQQSIDIQI